MPTTDYPPRHGININHVCEFVPHRLFKDEMKECRAWFSAGAGGSPTVDADGWPTGNWPVYTLLRSGSGGRYLSGDYTVLFDGTGVIALSGDAAATISTSGSTFNVATPSDVGVRLTISSSSAEPNHVRNVRVVHSSYLPSYAAEPITPEYANFVAPLGSILRMLDPCCGSLSAEIQWANRPTPSRYSYNSIQSILPGTTVRAVPLELQVDLCNLTGKHLWWCAPHRGTDEYFTEACRLIRDRLHPNLMLFIEYSNEVWNNQFAGSGDNGQYTWCQTEGARLGLGPTAKLQRHRYQKRRSVELFEIAESVFGGTARLERILSGQMADASVLTIALDFESEDNAKIDAVSVATYFGGTVGNSASNPSGRKPTTLEDVFTDLDLERPSLLSMWTSTTGTLAGYGKRLHAYEGGNTMITNTVWDGDIALQTLLNDANTDPRMVGVYDRWMRDCKTIGIDVLLHYGDVYKHTTDGTAARWGLAEYAGQPERRTPKLRAWLGAFNPTPAGRRFLPLRTMR